MMEDALPKSVTVYEVGPRDGLQNIDTSLDVTAKVRFIEALAASAGCPLSRSAPS